MDYSSELSNSWIISVEVVEETKIPLKIDAVSIKTKKNSEIVEWKKLKSQWIFYYCLILDIFILRHVRSVSACCQRVARAEHELDNNEKQKWKELNYTILISDDL